MSQTYTLATRGIQSLIFMVLPPNCLLCGIEIDHPGLCLECWPKFTFITPPQCLRCGIPFFDDTEMLLCGSCLVYPPPYTQARAAVIYDDTSGKLIYRFKKWDRTDSAPVLAQWMVRSGDTLFQQCDVIMNVPLHRYRLFSRRFNQSAMLAQAISRLVDRPVLTDTLERHRATTIQVGLKYRDRQRNIRGAFRLRHGHRERIVNRRVVLIDDVLTTGATVSECARILLHAGAAEVAVVTLARTVTYKG